jgi:hypothetical protein
MKSLSLLPALASLAFIAAAPANAQGMLGDEIRGQIIDVKFADGTVNAIYFGPDGTATISSASIGTVPATWAVEGEQLCLSYMQARECWAYASEFQALTPVTMSSSCNATSEWIARAVNSPAEVRRAGERG